MPEDQTQEIMDELMADNANIAGAGIRERNLPAGKYRFKGGNAYLNRSREKQRKQMVYVLEVIANDQDDKYNGSTYYKTWGLENEENYKWFNSDLTNLDIVLPVTAKDLMRIMSELDGIEFDASLVANKDEQYPPNCYINANARKDSGTASETGGGPSRF